MVIEDFYRQVAILHLSFSIDWLVNGVYTVEAETIVAVECESRITAVCPMCVTRPSRQSLVAKLDIENIASLLVMGVELIMLAQKNIELYFHKLLGRIVLHPPLTVL
jgi:hypothetical protein